MKVTRFGHSCVQIVDDSDRRVVLDPGTFSDTAAALRDQDAVLITHQHPDHLDVPALVAAAGANRDLKIWGPAGVTAQLKSESALDGRLTTVGAGESFIAGGLQVRTYGGQHALIHSSVPVVDNIAFLIGDAVYHPGDSYVVPKAEVELLLVPISAPWAKLSETLDFVISVRARRATGIHDAIISPIGHGLYDGQIGRMSEFYGRTRYEAVSPDGSLTL